MPRERRSRWPSTLTGSLITLVIEVSIVVVLAAVSIGLAALILMVSG